MKVGRSCGTCRMRKSRAKDPIRYAYNNSKNRAKQRKSAQWPDGIPFTITLDYFRRFCYRTNYHKNKGKSSESYSIDRKKEHLGYVPGNIASVKLGDNIRKYHKTKRCEWSGYHPEKGAMFVAVTEFEMPEEDKYF